MGNVYVEIQCKFFGIISVISTQSKIYAPGALHANKKTAIAIRH